MLTREALFPHVLTTRLYKSHLDRSTPASSAFRRSGRTPPRATPSTSRSGARPRPCSGARADVCGEGKRVASGRRGARLGRGRAAAAGQPHQRPTRVASSPTSSTYPPLHVPHHAASQAVAAVRRRRHRDCLLAAVHNAQPPLCVDDLGRPHDGAAAVQPACRRRRHPARLLVRSWKQETTECWGASCFGTADERRLLICFLKADAHALYVFMHVHVQLRRSIRDGND